MGWKYVMFKVGDYNFPIIFPDKLVHDEVAQALTPLVQQLGTTKVVEVVSAGEIDYPHIMSASGNSKTLKLSSRKKDTDIINRFTYSHGIE